ncbi:MAG: hypothetical protein IJ385_04645 [Ruminiclostridium sp.]|nr:hypothetical protein [Ruminiclostridium sp.]
MKKFLPVASAVICLAASVVFSIVAFAEELTEADKRIFGVFPIWLFILILAGAVMLAIIIIVEIAKRNQK